MTLGHYRFFVLLGMTTFWDSPEILIVIYELFYYVDLVSKHSIANSELNDIATI